MAATQIFFSQIARNWKVLTAGAGIVLSVAVGLSPRTPVLKTQIDGKTTFEVKVNGELTGSGTSRWGSGANTFTIDTTNNRVGVGTDAPDSALEVIGTLSGSSIEAFGLSDCDADNQALSYDATSKRFGCGDDDSAAGSTYYAGQGLSLSAGDSFSLKTTITGSLVSFTTASGATVAATNLLRSSGSLVTESGAIFDGGLFYINAPGNVVSTTGATLSMFASVANGSYILTMQNSASGGEYMRFLNRSNLTAISFQQTSNGAGTMFVHDSGGNTQASLNAEGDSFFTGGDVGVNTNNPDVPGIGLEIVGIASGSVLQALNTLASSGTLIWEGAASGSTLVVSGQFSGVGLSDCDDGTNSKLLWDATSKRFSCGSDQGGVGGGLSFAQADGIFVKQSGDSMTGGLIISSGNPQVTIDSGLLLEVVGTASGRVLHAQNTLRSSGSVVVEGTNNFIPAVSGSLVVSDTGLTNPPIELYGSRALGYQLIGLRDYTSRNQYAYFMQSDATNNVIEGYTPGGVLGFDVDLSNNGSQVYITANPRQTGPIFKVGTGALTEYLEVENDGDLNVLSDSLHVSRSLLRVGVGTISPETKLEVVGTASGDVLHAQRALRSSGSLVTESGAYIAGTSLVVQQNNGRVGVGTASPTAALTVIGTVSGSNVYAAASVTGAHLYAVSTFNGAALTDCDTASTSKLLWDATTKKFSCGTDDDVPESGDFAAAADLDADGTITDGVIDKADLSVSTDFGEISTDGSSNLTIDADVIGQSEVSDDALDFAELQDTLDLDAALTILTAGNAFEIVGTLSGTILHANTLLRSSGSLVTESGAYIDGSTLVVQAGNNRVGVGTASPKADLAVAGTVSGTTIVGDPKRSGLSVQVTNTGANVFTGSGVAMLDVPYTMSGYNLIHVHATVATAGTTNTTCVQVSNRDKGNRKMLSTEACIDSAETGSHTGAAPFVVNTSNDDVSGFNRLYIDVPNRSTTPPKGLTVVLIFEKP